MHASIAERFVYGRPYDPVAGDTVSPVVPRSGTALLGRILIGAIFVVSGFSKLTDSAGTIAYMTQAGVPSPEILVYVAGAAELAGGLALVLGFLTRIAALGLFVVMVLINYFMHAFWALEGAEAQAQMVQFMKNLAIMGGLAAFVAFGPGRYSVDAKLRRPKAP
jgi:putative oxidoreductase